jgi:hypothetical protein
LTSQLDPIPSVARRLRRAKFQPHHGRHQGKARNHLIEQIENFRVGDKDNKREDDLLDTFCYGIAISLGNREGF